MDKRLLEQWKKQGNILIGRCNGGRKNQSINFYADGRTISAKCFGFVRGGDAIALRDDSGQWWVYSYESLAQSSFFRKQIEYRKTKTRQQQTAFGLPILYSINDGFNEVWELKVQTRSLQFVTGGGGGIIDVFYNDEERTLYYILPPGSSPQFFQHPAAWWNFEGYFQQNRPMPTLQPISEDSIATINFGLQFNWEPIEGISIFQFADENFIGNQSVETAQLIRFGTPIQPEGFVNLISLTLVDPESVQLFNRNPILEKYFIGGFQPEPVELNIKSYSSFPQITAIADGEYVVTFIINNNSRDFFRQQEDINTFNFVVARYSQGVITVEYQPEEAAAQITNNLDDFRREFLINFEEDGNTIFYPGNQCMVNYGLSGISVNYDFNTGETATIGISLFSNQFKQGDIEAVPIILGISSGTSDSCDFNQTGTTAINSFKLPDVCNIKSASFPRDRF